MPMGVAQHEILHDKLNIDQTAVTVLDIEYAGRNRVPLPHLVAHGDDFLS